MIKCPECGQQISEKAEKCPHCGLPSFYFGGQKNDEINDDFSLKRYPGVYVTGELLDMDGICGGYNLFFAFASALLVAEG